METAVRQGKAGRHRVAERGARAVEETPRRGRSRGVVGSSGVRKGVGGPCNSLEGGPLLVLEKGAQAEGSDAPLRLENNTDSGAAGAQEV